MRPLTTDLRAPVTGAVEHAHTVPPSWGAKPVVFVFGGQGTQYYGMGRYHFEHDEVFRESALAMEQILCDYGHGGVLDEIMTRPPGAPFAMADLRLSHPGIAIIQFALADSLMARGIIPDIVAGSSLGELIALNVAGVLDREWLLKTLVEQIRSLERHQPVGSLLAILENHALFSDDPAAWAPLELAGISSSRHFVVAGPPEAIAARTAALLSVGITAEAAPVSYPFHSSLIDVIREDFFAALAHISLNRPHLPVMSAVTGREITEVTVEHLWRIAREPFRWQDAVFRIEENGAAKYVDLSPTGSMSSYLRMDFGRRLQGRVINLTGPFCPQEPVSARVAEIGLATQTPRRAMTQISATPGSTEPSSFVIPGNSAERDATIERLAVVFPGQGAQRVGMGADLFSRFPKFIREADQILVYSLCTLCLEDPDQCLS